MDSPLSSVPLPDIRRLEQFVAVAESGTLALAAKKLFLTQQALSTAIKRLEKELGVPLFDRSNRGLVLTAAGEELLQTARPFLVSARLLTQSVRRAADNKPREFRIGHSPAVSGSEVFSIAEEAVTQFPDYSMTAHQIFPDSFVSELQSGHLDLVLRRGVATPGELSAAVIAYQELRVALSSDDPLAEGTILPLEEFYRHPLVVWAPEHRSFYTDFLVSHCRRKGFDPPTYVNRVQGTPPTTAVLVYPDAFTFTTAPAGMSPCGRVAVRDLHDPPLSPIQALWLPNSVSPFRSAILKLKPKLLQPDKS